MTATEAALIRLQSISKRLTWKPYKPSTNGKSEKKPTAKNAKSEVKSKKEIEEKQKPEDKSPKPKRISAEEKIETTLLGAINTDNLQPPDPNFNDNPLVADPVEKVVEGASLEEDKMLDFDLDFIPEPENNIIPEPVSESAAETVPEPMTEAVAGSMSQPAAESSPTFPPAEREKIPESKPANLDDVNTTRHIISMLIFKIPDNI